LMVAAMSSNFGLIGFTVSETVRFLNFRILAWICIFTPTFRKFWGHIFQNDVTYRPIPESTFLRGNTSFEP